MRTKRDAALLQTLVAQHDPVANTDEGAAYGTDDVIRSPGAANVQPLLSASGPRPPTPHDVTGRAGVFRLAPAEDRRPDGPRLPAVAPRADQRVAARCASCDALITENDVWITVDGVLALCRTCGRWSEPPNTVGPADAPVWATRPAGPSRRPSGHGWRRADAGGPPGRAEP